MTTRVHVHQQNQGHAFRKQRPLFDRIDTSACLRKYSAIACTPLCRHESYHAHTHCVLSATCICNKSDHSPTCMYTKCNNAHTFMCDQLKQLRLCCIIAINQVMSRHTVLSSILDYHHEHRPTYQCIIYVLILHSTLAQRTTVVQTLFFVLTFS